MSALLFTEKTEETEMLFRISSIGETLKQGFGSGRRVGMFIDEQIGLDISTSI